MNDLLKSPQGDTSSKRVAGIALVAVGLGWGLWGSIRGTPLMVEYARWVVVSGAALLGIGVFEHRS